MLPSWSHRAMATIAGLDRDEDYIDAEREEPPAPAGVDRRAPCASPVKPTHSRRRSAQRPMVGTREPTERGHVQWTFIDEVARATTSDPRGAPSSQDMEAAGTLDAPAFSADDRELDARALILQRRSAVALGRRHSD